MGLDNYWMKNKEELGHVEGDFKICGGMLSGSGNDSNAIIFLGSCVESRLPFAFNPFKASTTVS